MSKATGEIMTNNSSTFKSDQEEILEGLERLSVSMKEMDATSVYELSHYRHLPEVVCEAREMLIAGASLIHGTATKYTLLGTMKMDRAAAAEEQMKSSRALLQGCQFLGTGCLLLHEPSVGCSIAFRRHVKQTCRAIVHTVIQLIASFAVDETALAVENVGAQKTGVVWQACNVILEKRMPIGNRTAIRRDLLTYMMECKETLEEFQEIMDAGPSLLEEEEEEENGGTTATTVTQQQQQDEDADWNEFLAGTSQKYSSRELPIASACLGIIKLSRGSINLALQACEAVGAQIQEEQEATASSSSETATPAVVVLSESSKARLQWLERTFQMACKLGDGMTDFGTNLYPPLDLPILLNSVETQIVQCIAPVVDLIFSTTTTTTTAAAAAPLSEEEDGTGLLQLHLPDDVQELATKLKHTMSVRHKEALDAVQNALQQQQ